jgi:hypothetical protein
MLFIAALSVLFEGKMRLRGDNGVWSLVERLKTLAEPQGSRGSWRLTIYPSVLDIVARPRLHAGGKNGKAPVSFKHPSGFFPKSPTPIILDHMIYLFLMHFVRK